jgi:hypothetical protein
MYDPVLTKSTAFCSYTGPEVQMQDMQASGEKVNFTNLPQQLEFQSKYAMLLLLLYYDI